jgi:uncharacterized protein YndB with AHSA1/START domain
MTGYLVIVVVLLLIAVLLGIAAGKPNTFTIKRSTEIEAAPETVWAYLEDFRRWTAWSPWEDMDPAMEKSYGGPATGVGSTYAWHGDKKVGAGHMEITEAKAPTKLALTLTMLRPFPATNTVEFFVTPLDGGVVRTAWVMTGAMPFMSKLMSVFFNMDKLVGKDFEKGLARLKAAAEAA